MYDHLSFPEAEKIQHELAKSLKFEPVKEIKYIAGADVSFNKDSTCMYATVVVLDYQTLALQSYALATYETTFPYRAGYLGFREVPALLKAWELIRHKPDVLVLDGNGILHPRLMGVAAHFGVLTRQTTIGCAKSLLYGQYLEPAATKFSVTPIKRQEKILGYVLRTKEKCKPVYISAGYGITSEQSLQVIKNCTTSYRIPEPTRRAHEIVNAFRTGKLKAGYHLINQPLTLFD